MKKKLTYLGGLTLSLMLLSATFYFSNPDLSPSSAKIGGSYAGNAGTAAGGAIGSLGGPAGVVFAA